LPLTSAAAQSVLIERTNRHPRVIVGLAVVVSTIAAMTILHGVR
jgi:hypothetical protein